MTNKIEARAIIDMLGTPKEHVEQILRDYIKKLKEDFTITNEEYAESVQKEKYYSTFVEIELEFEKMEDVLTFCFDAMPSSIEIMSPEKLSFDANVLTGFLNDLQAKVHQVDAIMKDVSAKQQLLDVNSMNILHNFIYFLVKQGDKTQEEISQHIGIGLKETKSFLNVMIKKGLIKEDGGKYTLASKT